MKMSKFWHNYILSAGLFIGLLGCNGSGASNNGGTASAQSGSLTKITSASTGSAQLYNYLGTGSNPHIILTLSANGAGWGGYSIDYQSHGGVPYLADPSKQWSSWNLTDQTTGVYLGTINLNYNGSTVSFPDGLDVASEPRDYTRPSPDIGNYLTGIRLNNGSSDSPSLTADSILCTTCMGPFPDAPAATPSVDFDLTTSSKLLLNGSPITIKGVVRPSLEWAAQGQYLSSADIINMKNFGANAIRLDLNASYWNSSAPSTELGSYKQVIDAMIYYATQNNMLVILDYHWNSTGQTNMAPKDASNSSLNFWTSVASKYKSFGNVIFELYNEPVNIGYNVWLNGDSSWYGMQDLYNAVRGTGATNVVIANGVDYAYYLGFIAKNVNNCTTALGSSTPADCFVKDSSTANGYAYNIIYGSHPYNNKGSANYKYNGIQADFATNFAGIKDSYPIIFTEFGDNQANDYNGSTYKSVYTAILNEIESDGINYTGFAWWADASQPAFPVLISGELSHPENAPVPAFGGIQIHADMQAHPGTTFKLQ